VFFWIPGGGLFGGAGNDYDMTALVNGGDAVVVSINYRVGVLGFFAHPALDAEHHDLGDYGIMDQQFALRWVQRNIAAFGGDPRNVTIFGQSAGGVSVLAHMASPGSAQLFQRAIVQSAGTPALVRTLTPIDRAEVTGQRFAAAAGCADQTIACLRALSAAQVMAAQPGNLTGLIGGVATLPKPFHAVFESGAFNRVPLMIGNVRDEWRWPAAQAEITSGTPLTAEKYAPSLAAFFGAASAPAIVAEYPLSAYPSPSEALGAAETDGYISCSSLKLDHWFAPFIPVYAYEFDDQHAPMYMKPVSFPYGAAHTIELQFLFPGYHGARGAIHPLNAAEATLAASMVRYWSNFAKRGNPNGPMLVAWPRYSADGDPMLSLNIPAPATFATFAAQHHCGFWDTVSAY
jgi:para-nitrobenzyl esterase